MFSVNAIAAPASRGRMTPPEFSQRGDQNIEISYPEDQQRGENENLQDAWFPDFLGFIIFLPSGKVWNHYSLLQKETQGSNSKTPQA